jgi:hypothetical protein
VPPDTRAQALSKPAATGRSVGQCTIGLASSGLGRVWRDILVSSRTSDSCGGPGTVHADQGSQVHGVSSNTLVRLAFGLDARCVKKQCGLVGLCFGGHMAFDLRLSRARTRVVAMRRDSNY